MDEGYKVMQAVMDMHTADRKRYEELERRYEELRERYRTLEHRYETLRESFDGVPSADLDRRILERVHGLEHERDMWMERYGHEHRLYEELCAKMEGEKEE